jgi:hypothetical protein
MNRLAPLCTILLGILPSFAATPVQKQVQKIGPQNRFHFSPKAWPKASAHASPATHFAGLGKEKELLQEYKNGNNGGSNGGNKSVKASPLSTAPLARHAHPNTANPPTGKLGYLAAPQIPAGGKIYDSAVTLSGDFNGDGKPDLVTQVEVAEVGACAAQQATKPLQRTGARTPRGLSAHSAAPQGECGQTYSISVILSNGDGTFQAPVLTAIPSDSDCSTMMVGDVNGDGKDDIVVVNQSGCDDGTSSIDVLISNGDGTFTVGNNYSITGNNLLGGVLADTTDDGKLDLVVVDQAAPANVWTLLGNGDGTFQTPTSVALSGAVGNGATFTDLNGDGLLDLAEMDGDTNQLTIFLATSATTYATGVSYNTSDTVYDACSLTAGDLTGDGKDEIVNANCNDNTLTVYVNNGDGTFQTGVYYADALSAPSGTTADLYPEGVAIADVNGDGKADIISSNADGGDATILLGNGDGTVSVPSIGYATGGFPYQPAIAADFNGDGNIDLVMPNLQFSLVFLKGYGDGTFYSALDYYSPLPSGDEYGVTVATGDFNGDGNPDFVLGNCCSGQAGITVFLSRSDGSLLPGVNYVSPNASQELQYVAVADFNQDGNLDIAAADSDNSAVQIFTGVGDGTFTLGPSMASGQSEDQPEGIVVADFNHDGFPDIAVANINDGTQDVGVLLNDGTGNFLAAVTYNLSNSFNDVGIAAVDLNNDGNPDLVIPITYGAAVAILLGNPDGTFQTEADLSIPSTEPFAVAVGDFNGDGKPDLAVTLTQDSTNGVAVALGNGDGTFQTPVIDQASLQNSTFEPPLPAYIETVDVDGDGHLDLVYTNSLYATVGVLFGVGDGTFDLPVEFPAGGFAYGLTIADVNHDGTPDVVTAGDDYSGVTVLLNLNGTGTQSTYTMTTSTPTVTVSAGSSAVYNLTITPANHYNGTVTMSCGTLPALTTCSFNPPSFLMDGHTPVAVQLTVTTTAAGAALRKPEAHLQPGRRSPMLLAAFGGIGLFGIVLCGRRKHASRLLTLLLALVAAPVLLSLNGCGKDCDDYANECPAPQVATSASMTSSLNPAAAGQVVIFTATITSTGGTPTGTVAFLDGTTQLGTGNLSSGVATYQTSTLTAGAHTITANYVGNASYGASTSSALTETIGASTAVATTATVTSSLNPAVAGQAVTFTVTITSGAGTPTGSVTFLDGTTTLGTVTLASGAATYQTSSLTAGAHSITATYAGNATFLASTSPAITENISSASAAATAATVTSSLNPANSGQAVTFTATITSSGGTPTGTVTFLDGATQLGTGTLSSGVATYQTSSLTSGTHNITASYGGNATFQASTSPVLTETIDSLGTPAGTYTIPINATGTTGTNGGNSGTQSLSVTLIVQ